jgi:hypothetical protein
MNFNIYFISKTNKPKYIITNVNSNLTGSELRTLIVTQTKNPSVSAFLYSIDINSKTTIYKKISNTVSISSFPINGGSTIYDYNPSAQDATAPPSAPPPSQELSISTNPRPNLDNEITYVSVSNNIVTETLATNSNYPINLQIGVSTGVFANINITTPDNLNSYIEVKIILYSYVKNSDGVSSLQSFTSSIISGIKETINGKIYFKYSNFTNVTNTENIISQATYIIYNNSPTNVINYTQNCGTNINSNPNSNLNQDK